jgi:hypothetical protein
MADQTTTLTSSRVSRLSAEETREHGFTHKFVITASDINNSAWTTDGDTVTVTLGTTPAKHLVSKAVALVTTAFVTDGTLTLQVGTSTDQDNFIDAQSCKTAGPLIGAAGGVPVTEAASFANTAQTLVARFTTQGSTGAPSDISAGEVTILLAIDDLGAAAA